MSCEFKCDACGRTAPALEAGGSYYLPGGWRFKYNRHGRRDACSEECLGKLAGPATFTAPRRSRKVGDS